MRIIVSRNPTLAIILKAQGSRGSPDWSYKPWDCSKIDRGAVGVVIIYYAIYVFTQRNFLAEFLQLKCDFKPYAAVFAFWNTPLGALGTTYDVHLGLVAKRVVDFLLVLIELLSLGVTVEALRAKIDRKSAISL